MSKIQNPYVNPSSSNQILHPVNNSPFLKFNISVDNQHCNLLVELIFIKNKINLAWYGIHF